MSRTRRDFVRLSVAACGVLAGGGLGAVAARAEERPKGRPALARLDILVLGGTGFIGPHEIRYALDRGHNVTMFNRGRSNTQLFPDVERLIGDRGGDLDALTGRQWDVVIDNSGFYPRHAKLSAELLEPNVGMYLFVSSISAYDTEALQAYQRPTEAPLATMADPTDESESPYGPSYGPRKALCEAEISKVFGPDRTTIVRPGLITGPGDPTDRVRHWFARVERGGEVLVPGTIDGPTQYIDARDMTAWMVRLMEDGTAGTFNGAGPRDALTSAELVYALAAAVPSERRFTWVDWDFLTDNDVNAFAYNPLVPPPAEPFMQIFNADAVESGLRHRTLAATVTDMYEEYLTVSNGGFIENFGWRSGLSSEAEARVLSAWHSR